MRNIDAVIELVIAEIDRQDAKWGADRLQHPLVWNAILTEEVGEFSQATLHSEYGGIHAGTELTEAIQVAAVAMQIVNDLILKGGEG